MVMKLKTIIRIRLKIQTVSLIRVKKRVIVDGSYNITAGDEEQLKEELYANGPVSVAFQVVEGSYIVTSGGMLSLLSTSWVRIRQMGNYFPIFPTENKLLLKLKLLT
jgi:hypothetical protein